MRIRSLKTKSTIAFSFLGLFPLLITGLIAGYIVNTAHKQDVLTIEHQLLSEKHAEIDQYLERLYSITAIKVGYPDKKIIAPLSQKDILNKLHEDYPEFLELTFTDAEGNITSKISSFQDTELINSENIGASPAFRKAVSGNFYIGHPEYTKYGPILLTSAPVVNNVGDVIMTLSVLIDLKPLQGLISRSKLGSTGYVFLLDESSRMLAGPNQDQISKAIHKKFVPQDSDGLSTLEGFDTHTVLAASEIIDTTNWRLVVHWPKDDAFAVVNRLQYQLLATILISIALVFVGGIYVRRRVVDPMLVIEKGAEKIGQGKFDEQINISTGDELEELGNVFNKMEIDLKKLEELKVAEARAEALAESLRKEKLLSQIKEDFINNTSHQLRTPLAVIRWSSELLAGNITDPKMKGIMDGVTTGVHELNAIVHDLITVSNFGFGYKNKINNEFDIAASLEKLKSKYQKEITQKSLNISIDKKTELKAIGDPVALDILFENILDNALTYTKEKGQIKILLEEQQGSVLFSIEDNGIGITTKDQKSIFNQFFRATNAIVMKNVGTGLGLYISRLIVEGHGGKIWFESTEGQGSKFYILLPTK